MQNLFIYGELESIKFGLRSFCEIYNTLSDK